MVIPNTGLLFFEEAYHADKEIGATGVLAALNDDAEAAKAFRFHTQKGTKLLIQISKTEKTVILQYVFSGKIVTLKIMIE